MAWHGHKGMDGWMDARIHVTVLIADDNDRVRAGKPLFRAESPQTQALLACIPLWKSGGLEDGRRRTTGQSSTYKSCFDSTPGRRI